MQMLKTFISKHIKKRSPAWYSLHFFYDFLTGHLWLRLHAYFRRRRQVKNLPRYASKLLEEVLDACRIADISPFPVRGTLLGFWRERGIVQSDYDMDLGLLSQDFHKIEALKKAMEQRSFKVRVDHRYLEPLRKIGERFSIQFVKPSLSLWVDFDLFYEIDGQLAYIEDRRFDYTYEGKEFADKNAFGADIAGFALVYPREIFSSFKKMEFLNSEILIPVDTEKYLSLTYGDWSVPRQKNQSTYKNIKAVRYDPAAQGFNFLAI